MVLQRYIFFVVKTPIPRENRFEAPIFHVQKVYTMGAERHPLRHRVAQMPHRENLLSLYRLAGNCWAENYWPLRFWLAFLQSRWPSTAECPIALTEEEISEAAELYLQQKAYEEECELVYSELHCQDDGEITGATQADVDSALARCAEMAAKWDETSQGGPFPIRAGSAASLSTIVGE